MATAKEVKLLLTCCRSCRSLRGPQSRAFAALVPGVSQVDNNSDFLGKKPHRKHPGILRLPHVRLPQALANAAQLLLFGEKLREGETKETKRGQHVRPVRSIEKQVQALSNYLWSRHLPIEPEELQRRAADLEKKFLENQDSTQTEEKLRGAVLQALRRTTYHWQKLSYNEELSLIYMAARLDGGFAAVLRAFHEIQARIPEFQPQTLMDFGSGTGSVAWAAHSTWGQSLREYVCVDSSAAMLDLAEKLLKGGSESGKPCIPGVFFRQFLPVQFDVVVSAFALNELPSKADRIEVVQNLWRKTSHFLVLVENGTKAGHRLLMDARDLVLQNKKPKEERFSMVILARGSPKEANRWPRVTQPVLKRPRHVHCHLCCPDGHTQHAVVTARRHGRDLYRCARVSSWGDLLPVIAPSEFPLSPAEEPTES
ncbi:hypothetical protein A6R68_14898 [Neotoma lepida]|uniref:Ribosome assembly protein METTL17, mitochondrial n=1 Tax=Neotoma lepida TaxID=56216 RepID=A0A1A6H7I7_NEOLE|nr:hypothetical protein A6R68_14898 [Neotoma lepida]